MVKVGIQGSRRGRSHVLHWRAWRWVRLATTGLRQSIWVATTDLPRNAGYPFYERLNRILSAAGFDAFVEGLCARFYTGLVARLGGVRASAPARAGPDAAQVIGRRGRRPRTPPRSTGAGEGSAGRARQPPHRRLVAPSGAAPRVRPGRVVAIRRFAGAGREQPAAAESP